MQIHAANIEDEVSEDGEALYFVFYVVEDAGEDEVHALDVSHLWVLSSITHQDLPLLFLESRVLKSSRVALGTVDVLHDLLEVLASLFAAFGIFRWVSFGIRLNHAFPTNEELYIVILDDF